MKNFLIKSISTFLGTGYSPLASGTLASALCALLIWFLVPSAQSPIYPLIVFTSAGLAIPFCSIGEKFWSKTDDRHIVIDEAVGQAITYIWMPHDWRLFVIGFLLFRLYDVVKIPPAGRAQRIKGGLGVLLDDVIAGIYANIGLWIARYFLKI